MKHYITLLFLCITTAAFAQKTNFSGTYTVEAEKIDWGPAPHFILPADITVTQQSGKLTVIRDWTDAQGTTTPDTTILTPDGKAYLHTSKSGKKHSSALQWTADGNSFTITDQATDDSGGQVGYYSEVWSITNNELLVVRTVDQQTNSMKYTIKAYFAKK